ncbi:MAG: 3-keto-5-aminohexanoate cleavage protein [Dehalococcoidales bacterium]|nr:3-keto-5-aminohexanoate cleavage protein [Dehalococcoidales bacterium]
MDKLIITCAVTGSRITREQSPAVPLTPDEIIDSAVESHLAGAAVVHLHVRDPITLQGTQDVEIFRRVSSVIKERCDVIQCFTTSGIPGRNLSDSERMAPLALNPEMASVDLGSVNFGQLPYIVTEDFIERILKEMLERKIKPELEVFDLGMIGTCQKFIRQGLVNKPFYFGLILGTASGAPASVKTLQTMLDLLPGDSLWFTTGIGRHSLTMATLAILLGGHVRVGLEDTVTYAAGVPAKSNAELVARIVRIAGELGREIATPAEARRMLVLDPPSSSFK